MYCLLQEAGTIAQITDSNLDVAVALRKLQEQLNLQLASTPYLGVDEHGNSVQCVTGVWVRAMQLAKAEELFEILDAEKKGFWTFDSLHYFYSVLAPEHKLTEAIRQGIDKLLRRMLHYHGLVSPRGIKLLLIRFGFSSVESLVVLQSRLSCMSDRWKQLKSRLLSSTIPILSVSMHFALTEAFLPDVWEQAVQLALPLSLKSHTSVLEFLRTSAPLLFVDSEFTEGSLIKSSRGLVEELVSRHPGFSSQVVVVIRKTVEFYDKLLEHVLTSLVVPASPEAIRSRNLPQQASPGAPRYSKPTFSSTSKNIFEAEGFKKKDLLSDIPTVHVNVLDLLEERPRQAQEDLSKKTTIK